MLDVSQLGFLFLVLSLNLVPGMSSNDVYVHKMLNFNGYYLLARYRYLGVLEQACPMMCSVHKATGYIYISDTKDCRIFWMAKEYYTDYIPGTAAQDLWVNFNIASSINNYNLISVGSPSNTVISLYQNGELPGGHFHTNLYRATNSEINSAVNGSGGVSVLDLEGVNFNWKTRILSVCGGRQDSVGEANSDRCYTLATISPWSMLDPWRGPFLMLQGRQQPLMVSVHSKVYILGGLVKNASIDVVEVLDFVTKKVNPLKNANNLPITNPNLVNIIDTCAVGLDDMNSFFIAGGNSTQNGIVASTYMLDLNNEVWITLPSMNNPRYGHECARITQSNKDYIIVVGGMNLQGFLLSAEMYDLKQLSGSWKLLNRSIPNAARGGFLGSVITVFNEDFCDAFFLSATTGQIAVCSNNYQWTYYTPPEINGITTKFDANIFSQ